MCTSYGAAGSGYMVYFDHTLLDEHDSSRMIVLQYSYYFKTKICDIYFSLSWNEKSLEVIILSCRPYLSYGIKSKQITKSGVVQAVLRGGRWSDAAAHIVTRTALLV